MLSKNRRSEENTNVIIGSNDKIDIPQIILYEDSIPHTGNSYPSTVQRNLEDILVNPDQNKNIIISEIIPNKPPDYPDAPEIIDNNEPAVKKKVFTKKSKIQIFLKAIELGNNSKAARLFSVNEITVKKYRSELQNYPEIQDHEKKNKKKIRRERKGKFPEIDDRVFKWIIEQRQRKLIVRLNDIKKSLRVQNI